MQAAATDRVKLEVLIVHSEINMPVLAWLLGVPITVIIVLMLLGVF